MKLLGVLLFILIWPPALLAQVYDPNDTALRKSFEKELSTSLLRKNRLKDVEPIVNSFDQLKAIVIFIVGGPTLHLNPENVHTSAKDFLEFLHDRYNRESQQVFLRKLQNNALSGQTEEQICHLITLSKRKFPDAKAILVGHSYGGSGAVRVARCLEKNEIILDELVTVDTVHRPVDWNINVWSIPYSVRENFHFHQKRGILQGPRANHRPDGTDEGIENYRQFIGKGLFNPHMYAFTNLIRYNLLQSLALRVLEPSKISEANFREILALYLEKHPLE